MEHNEHEHVHHEHQHEGVHSHHDHRKAHLSTFIAATSVITVVLLLVMAVQLGSINASLKVISEKGIAAQGQAAAPPQANNPAPTQPATQPVVDMKALMGTAPVKGSANAKVTIVEFTDYQCPFCSRFFKDTYPQIDQQYIKTGKVKLVVRNFPLSFHPYAQKSAEAVECAGDQGKFFEMHDKIFANQEKLNLEILKTWAQEIGLDTSKFNDCLDTGKMAEKVKKDAADGQAAGVRGTPAFFINGQLVSGAQPFANFQQVIDAKLAD